MKRQKSLILIALLALIAAACAQPTPAPTLRPPEPAKPTSTVAPQPTRSAPAPASQDDSWQKVQQAGVLRVGTSGDYPPFEYYNDKFALDGFDVALSQQIGKQLGLKVELNDFAFDGLPAAVAADQVDVAIGALSVTPERQAIADFSNVYFASTDAVLARPEADPKNLQNAQALAAARLGVQTKSIYENYAQEKLIDAGVMPKQNLYVYTDMTQAVSDLKAKRIDAVWLDLKPAQSFVNEGGVKILTQDLNQQLYAIGLKKGSGTLRDKINEALTQLQNDGTLAKLQEQYLGIKAADVVPPPLLPTPAPQPTPEPARCLDNAKWLADLSYDDKEMTAPPVLNPGQPFTKGWRMQNIGACAWTTKYVMAFSQGNVPAAQMGGQPIPVTKEVKPGETFDFQVNLIAPIVPGTYQGFWNVRNDLNQKFGETVWVGITVPGATPPPPPPTQTPVPNISFTADRTTITAGQPVLFKWAAEGVKAVYFYHDGQNWSDHGVAGVGQSTEYPPYTLNYYLRVVQRNDAVVVRTIAINVNPAVGAPVIDYLSASPPQITVGQCVGIDWSVSGQVSKVALLINNSPVWDGAPVSGNYKDCPNAAGTRVYTLQAAGTGGNATQQTSVNVQNIPNPPTWTPVPITPAPQPPAIQNFNVAPTNIEQGQCVVASWNTGGGTTRVQLLRDDAVIWEGPQLNSSVQDCPPNAAPATIKYSLIAYNNADQQDGREVQVQVAPAPPQNPLANTSWRLQSGAGLGEGPIDTVTAYFGADGGLSGNGGCNSYNTSYTVGGQAITIYPPTSTGALCGDPADTMEQTYLGLLPQAANFQINGNQLILTGNSGQEILRYTRAG